MVRAPVKWYVYASGSYASRPPSNSMLIVLHVIPLSHPIQLNVCTYVLNSNIFLEVLWLVPSTFGCFLCPTVEQYCCI